MKVGATLSTSSALEAFLAAQEEDDANVTKKTSSTTEADPLLKTKYEMLQCALDFLVECLATALNDWAGWWGRQGTAWSCVLSPQSCLWFKESANVDRIPSDLGLCVVHAFLCIAFLVVVLVAWLNTFYSGCWLSSLIVLGSRYTCVAIFGPFIMGYFISHQLEYIHRITNEHHTLIRRCLHLSRRSALLSMGAVCSYPLPAVTHIEEHLDAAGSFMSASQLKSIKMCILANVIEIREFIIGLSRSEQEHFLSTKAVADEANKLFRKEIPMILVALFKPINPTKSDKIFKRSDRGNIISQSLKTVIITLGHSCKMVWRLAQISAVMFHSQHRLLKVLASAGVSKDIITELTAGMSGDINENKQTELLVKDVSKALANVNRLRQRHEWEAIRLWNCEVELSTLLNAIVLSSGVIKSQRIIESHLKRVSRFLSGIAVQLHDDLAADALDADGAAEAIVYRYPKIEDWKQISVQLNNSITEYVQSLDLGARQGIEGLYARHVVEAALTSAEHAVEVTDKDEFCIRSQAVVGAPTTGEFSCNLGEHEIAKFLNRDAILPSDKLIVDIFSGIVTPTDGILDTKEFKSEADQNHTAACGLMNELKHHVSLRIMSTGLMVRENGGVAIPMVDPEGSRIDMILPAGESVKEKSSEEENGTAAGIACNLTGNSKTISMLNLDLSAALKLRKPNGSDEVGQGMILSYGSSDDEDEIISS